MNQTRVLATTAFTKPPTTQTLRLLSVCVAATTPTKTAAPAFRLNNVTYRTFSASAHQNLSSTNPKTKEPNPFFPPPENANIRTTEPAWPHPIYSQAQMEAVVVAHRNTASWSDWVALGLVRVLRWGLDIATGYRHGDARALSKVDPERARERYGMTERKYMIRNVFLESVAGVPGMVAAMLRHLHSLRRMKRDNGWIETLLEESYNERMHLLTFLRMSEPGLFMRIMVLGTQGVFFNAFFLAYLLSPRTCHRFVGYLEEEAVLTYTRQIEDLDNGQLPKWESLPAPDIAVQYWKMPEGNRMMRDLLMYIRADESKHREVNHTLGNLDQKTDPNPYVSEYRDADRPHPSKDLAFQRPLGWEKKDVM